MIEFQYFRRTDFPKLIEWAHSPSFLMQWGGPGFHYPLIEQQLEEYLKDANEEEASQFNSFPSIIQRRSNRTCFIREN